MLLVKQSVDTFVIYSNKNTIALEKKKEYIDNLLSTIKSLEKTVIAAKDEGAIPFSFFREAFDKTETIMRLLHELEYLQIDEMREQMEKLILFLSEAENNKKAIEKAAETGVIREISVEKTKAVQEEEVEKHEEEDEAKSGKQQLPKSTHNEGPMFSEYKWPGKKGSEIGIKKKETPSLNDAIPAKPVVLDLIKSISLNDRFLFQRELFNNDREAMNAMMEMLNSFENYEEAEAYLRKHTSWNFEDQTVMDFLYAIKKGFE